MEKVSALPGFADLKEKNDCCVKLHPKFTENTVTVFTPIRKPIGQM